MERMAQRKARKKNEAAAASQQPAGQERGPEAAGDH